MSAGNGGWREDLEFGSYEDFGGSQDFMATRNQQSSYGHDYSHQMDHDTTMNERCGHDEIQDHQIGESSQDLVMQNPTHNEEVAGFSSLVFTHQVSVLENTQHRSQFEPPLSPESSYNSPFISDDYSREPPALPPQLDNTVLNVQSNTEDSPSSRPSHSTLEHLYMQRNDQVVALASTSRFHGKYVSRVLYKPS